MHDAVSFYSIVVQRQILVSELRLRVSDGEHSAAYRQIWQYQHCLVCLSWPSYHLCEQQLHTPVSCETTLLPVCMDVTHLGQLVLAGPYKLW